MFEFHLCLAALALILEALLGYPPWLLRRIGHPVIWIGALIAWADRRMNRDTMPEARRRLNGVGALLLVLGAAVLPALLIEAHARAALPELWALILLALLASSLLAQRSLIAHVGAVADALDHEGLTGGRQAVARIVGRDPETLDEAGVARAAIESLAENFADGVVAPAFWCALAGLPGLAAHKAVNTADSMIGHLSPRHRAFGWAAAKLDDLVNLPAARLAALWLVLAALLHPRADGRAAWRLAWRDHARHRSPNAGWPEAAMAGALGLRLAGPRAYGGARLEEPWLGDGRAEADAADIRAALALCRLACAIEITVFAALALFIAQA
jgi:adenosylcobinamide-phosphate synthase